MFLLLQSDLDRQILLKFATNIDKDLDHLSRLAVPCALSLGSCHLKTLWGTFFPHKYPGTYKTR